MTQRARRPSALIVVLGIDGAGKTSAAQAVKELFPRTPVLVLGNYSGRKTISALAHRFHVPLPVQLADVLETVVRVFNVLINHLRAARFDGLVIMDRHLYCQLALRKARGIRRSRMLEALLGVLPRAQAVVYFDIPAELAYERIALRAEDQEHLEDLQRFRKAYLELPWYPSFAVIDAGGSVESSAQQLQQIIAGALPSSAALPE
jgi:dTMP kinase